MYSQPENKKNSDYQENFILYGMPKEEWIDGWVDNFDNLDDEDDNTGGIAPTPRPKQPKPSPKTNNSETLPD